MKLKKIYTELQRALEEAGLNEANELQTETFSTIKSGADAVIQAEPGSGKSTIIAINVIQRLQKAEAESTRALVLCEDRDSVVAMTALFRQLAIYTDLRIFGVHEKGDIDFDKNHISLGMDILIGTPVKVNTLFSTAGFNMGTVKMLIVDDADRQFKNRADSIVQRLSASVEKTQRLFFTSTITERVETLADKIMIEPVFFEMDGEE